MTEEDINNERLKLVASWLNTLATAVMTAGAFLPIAQLIFGILPEGTKIGLVYSTGGICVGVGFALHLIGQWALGGLE